MVWTVLLRSHQTELRVANGLPPRQNRFHQSDSVLLWRHFLATPTMILTSIDYCYFYYWPSPGSWISTVAFSGNSSSAMTGSDRTIWKRSDSSYSPSDRMRTLQTAVVWPGLNWTCFWDFPRKSLSLVAVPSRVPMPVGATRGRETRKHPGNLPSGSWMHR